MERGQIISAPILELLKTDRTSWKPNLKDQIDIIEKQIMEDIAEGFTIIFNFTHDESVLNFLTGLGITLKRDGRDIILSWIPDKDYK